MQTTADSQIRSGTRQWRGGIAAYAWRPYIHSVGSRWRRRDPAHPSPVHPRTLPGRLAVLAGLEPCHRDRSGRGGDSGITRLRAGRGACAMKLRRSCGPNSEPIRQALRFKDVCSGHDVKMKMWHRGVTGTSYVREVLTGSHFFPLANVNGTAAGMGRRHRPACRAVSVADRPRKSTGRAAPARARRRLR